MNYLGSVPRLAIFGWEQKNKMDDTPLHTALRYHNNAAAEWLIARGADINTVNFKLKSARKILEERSLEDLTRKAGGLDGMRGVDALSLEILLGNEAFDGVRQPSMPRSAGDDEDATAKYYRDRGEEAEDVVA
uniref:Uncharacterized protein n=1 Tax=Lotharella oceanica TaxID=641309 RepID=A0A7S2TW41_9EUKA